MTRSFLSKAISLQRTKAERRRRRLVVVLAAGLASGCLLDGCGYVMTDPGTSTGAQTQTSTRPARHSSPPRARPNVPRKPVKPAQPRRKPKRPQYVVVTVVNGDTNHRVAGATVSIGARTASSDRHGQAIVRVLRRATLIVRASADGFRARSQIFSFRPTSRRTIRIYRPALQWPMYGVGPTRTQAQTAIRLRPPFRIVWSRSLHSLVEFPAVVSDGMAYVANAGGTVWAISMRTGAVAWSRRLRTRMAASPAIAGRNLVVHTMGRGKVYVLRRSDGKILLRKYVGSPIESSPVVEHGIDYFGSWNGRVYAFDLRRRRFRWIFRSGYKITAAAALTKARVYIGDYSGRVLVLSKKNGRLRFAPRVNGKIYGAVAIARGRFFVPSSTGNSITAFTLNGRRLWTRVTGNYVYSSPAVWRGRVFFGSYDGVFYCLSAASGRTLWSLQTGSPISGAAVVVSGVAYAGNFGHRIYGVDALSGRVLVRFPHGDYVPVSGNGQRLLFHGYSRIWALEPKAATATVRAHRAGSVRRNSRRRKR
ncbi:MAG: PQQ-binding-like beta-propeller repeat protein [Gaiellaceae bacterium]